MAKPEFIPTPEQIAAEAEKIRSEWSRDDRARRGGGSRCDLRSQPRLIVRNASPLGKPK